MKEVKQQPEKPKPVLDRETLKALKEKKDAALKTGKIVKK